MRPLISVRTKETCYDGHWKQNAPPGKERNPMTKKKTNKRHVFAELMEGVDAMKQHREGKVTLRTHKLSPATIVEAPGAEYFVAAREKFNVSRAVWANMLHVSPRTVEKWEQSGQASPLAATFVELVSQYPDTIERLQTLPKLMSKSARS
jgi:putative transcriptional regulator